MVHIATAAAPAALRLCERGPGMGGTIGCRGTLSTSVYAIGGTATYETDLTISKVHIWTVSQNRIALALRELCTLTQRVVSRSCVARPRMLD